MDKELVSVGQFTESDTIHGEYSVPKGLTKIVFRPSYSTKTTKK